MVFGGIVVLCSIFFVLGMLVGRMQGQKIASGHTAEAAAAERAAPPSLTFDESVENNEPAPLEPQRFDENVTNFQIGALRKAADAEKLLAELREKGFRAFILSPASGDPNPFFRVQVGPITRQSEIDSIKRQLESAGYKPIIRK
jgi:cell division septation protein DedD